MRHVDLQCCGCNATVDEHQAEDENGIVENLKDIADEFKQVRVRQLSWSRRDSR